MADLVYGLDADLKRKQAENYDDELEAQVVGWIEAITGEKKGETPVGEWLKDGLILCSLANAIKPGIVKKTNASKMPFKQMENITFFMNAAREIGVAELAMFGTPDLYEEKNLGSVMSCINTFGGVVQVAVPEFAGPKLGQPVHAHSKDAKRAVGPATQSGGLQVSMDVSKNLGSRASAVIGESPRPKDAVADAQGLDADIKKKQAESYDPNLEKEVVGWIEAVTGEAKGAASVAEWLKNGKVLCQLANTIKPGVIKKVNESALPFKQMENITFFMDAARGLGVPELSMFGTPDLYEEKNIMTVLSAIYCFAGHVQVSVPEFAGPKLGQAIKSDIEDEKRGVMLGNLNEGDSRTMQIERPKDFGITRGANV